MKSSEINCKEYAELKTLHISFCIEGLVQEKDSTISISWWRRASRHRPTNRSDEIKVKDLQVSHFPFPWTFRLQWMAGLVPTRYYVAGSQSPADLYVTLIWQLICVLVDLTS